MVAFLIPNVLVVTRNRISNAAGMGKNCIIRLVQKFVLIRHNGLCHWCTGRAALQCYQQWFTVQVLFCLRLTVHLKACSHHWSWTELAVCSGHCVQNGSHQLSRVSPMYKNLKVIRRCQVKWHLARSMCDSWASNHDKFTKLQYAGGRIKWLLHIVLLRLTNASLLARLHTVWGADY